MAHYLGSNMDLVITAELMLLVCSLSCLGGIGSFLQGKRDKRLRGNFLDFITELFLAQIVGLATAYLGHNFNWNEAITCFIVLIISNNAAETINFFKKTAKAMIRTKLGLSKDKQ